jgi:hypothetical protein
MSQIVFGRSTSDPAAGFERAVDITGSLYVRVHELQYSLGEHVQRTRTTTPKSVLLSGL